MQVIAAIVPWCGWLGGANRMAHHAYPPLLFARFSVIIAPNNQITGDFAIEGTLHSKRAACAPEKRFG